MRQRTIEPSRRREVHHFAICFDRLVLRGDLDYYLIELSKRLVAVDAAVRPLKRIRLTT